MTAQPVTPNVGAQPTPTRPPKLTLPEGAHLAQPTPPNHAQSSLWAFRTSLGFLLAAVLVDWAGHQPEGVAGIVLGVGALGVSVAYAHAHDRSAHAQPTVIAPEVWAPMSKDEALAVLDQIAAQSRSSRSLGGAE